MTTVRHGFPLTACGNDRSDAWVQILMVTWQTFVVRIWQESSSTTWRGQIVHLPDQTTRHFATLAQAVAFIDHYLGANLPSASDALANERKGETEC